MVSAEKKLDYLGQWFLRLDDETDAAHRLGAYTFGLYKTRHFQGEDERTSDSADLSMWEEMPILRELRSRSRIRKKAGETESIRDPKDQQKQAREAILASAEQFLLLEMVDAIRDHLLSMDITMDWTLYEHRLSMARAGCSGFG
ncbi:MAG: DUF2397 family protein [Gorillibacterium sp.]|nr:DUF2397 family protein [Gorillibacterium sp.]